MSAHLSIRGGEITDDYTHPGWNLRQAGVVGTVLIVSGVVVALLTSQCQPQENQQKRIGNERERTEQTF